MNARLRVVSLCILLAGCSVKGAPPGQRASAELTTGEAGPRCAAGQTAKQEPVDKEDEEVLRRLGVPAALYPEGLPACVSAVDPAPVDQEPLVDQAPPVDKAPPTAADTDASGDKRPICPMRGFADLHTHMFAELAWDGNFIWGHVDDVSSANNSTFAEALPRCSGAFDHATIKPGYGLAGLGIVSEGLTAIGGLTAFTGMGGVTAGDSGLHLLRRNGYDTRKCSYACRGPGTCATHLNQAACESADPGFCQDNIPSNVSIAALTACNLKTDRNACESGGYCGAVGSSLWSVADDINPCWAQWPTCDNGDLCLQRDITKLLECNDLSQTECQNHGSECAWSASCKYHAGMLECNDLSQAECANHAQCHWSSSLNSCKHDLLGAPLECNDLSQMECQNHSNECAWEAKCTHPIFAASLECRDLSLAECANHYSDGGCGVRDCRQVDCHWEDLGTCQWQSVWPPKCGEHFTGWPAWDTATHQQHYWGWLKDAHDRGLQLVSASILEVHPLSKLFAGYHRTPYQVITEQLIMANEFAAKHASWAGIAHSATEANDLIKQGKLAIVLTLEAEFPFCKQEPCGAGADETDWVQINATLDEYYARGLRGFQIVGHFDNLHAGVGIYAQAIHSMQWLFQSMSADGMITALEFTSALASVPLPAVVQQVDGILNLFNIPASQLLPTVFPVVGFGSVNDVHALGAILGRITGTSCVFRGTNMPVDCGTCLKDKLDCSNEIGLTPLGGELVRQLKQRKMLIDIAHMGDRGVQNLEDMLNNEPGGADYPFYVSHGDPREALGDSAEKGPHQEKPSSVETLAKLRRRGGMFGQRTGSDRMKDASGTNVPNDCDGSSKSFAQALSYLTDQGIDVGFAFDFNGMTHQSVPRFTGGTARGTKAACLGDNKQQALQGMPLGDDPSTPYTDERDLNTKGLAHIGLAGAYMQELRNIGVEQRHLDNLLCGANNFINMWRRAER